MPSKSNYRTEEEYLQALRAKREAYEYRKQQKELKATKTISEINIYADGPVPEHNDELCETNQINIIHRECDRESERMRKHIVGMWRMAFKSDCIVVIDNVWNKQNNSITYIITLTGWGANVRSKWLKDIVEEWGWKPKQTTGTKRYGLSHRIISTDAEGNKQVWESVSKAAEGLNVPKSNIYQVLRGKQQRARAYHFEYEEKE